MILREARSLPGAVQVGGCSAIRRGRRLRRPNCLVDYPVSPVNAAAWVDKPVACQWHCMRGSESSDRALGLLGTVDCGPD